MQLIVDSQIHFWDQPHVDGPAPASRLTADEMLPLMDRAGVQRAILVPPRWASDGNRTSLAAASAHPGRFSVMAKLPLDKPLTTAELLDLLQDPNMVGVRIAFAREPMVGQLLSGSVEWAWAAAARADAPVMVFAPGLLASVDRVARAYPELRICLDHLSMWAPLRGASRDAELRDLTALARHENVTVKLSELPLHSDMSYPFDDVFPMVNRVIDAFGPQRCFWGSDFSQLKCSYQQAVGMMTECLATRPVRDRALIMGEGLLRWLRLSGDTEVDK